MLCGLSLTSRQEKFVQGILEGKTQHIAYMEAYPSAKKWKIESVKTSASRLLKNEKVAGRLNELKKDKEKSIIYQKTWDYLESEKALKWILKKSMQDVSENGVRQANSSTIINAVKELNDMMYKLKDYEDYQEFNRLKKEKMQAEINNNNSSKSEETLAKYFEILDQEILDD